MADTIFLIKMRSERDFARISGLSSCSFYSSRLRLLDDGRTDEGEMGFSIALAIELILLLMQCDGTDHAS